MSAIVTLPEIYTLLRFLRIYPKYRGYRYMASSIHLVAQNEDLLFSVTKVLYPRVAEMYGTKWTTVEHDMRTVISQCWADGGKPALEEIAGREIAKRPVTVEFIDIAANYLVRRAQAAEPPCVLVP